MKKMLLILLVGLLFLAGYDYQTKVTRYELPKGELKWSKVRPRNAKMCLPAAFTGDNGKVLNAYRLNGKNYNANNRRLKKVSLVDNSFIITNNWRSDNGFQQLALVLDSKPSKFGDRRVRIRRALCKKNGVAFILQSNYPMTLTTFAYYCSRHCDNAAYLDMGEYGYGYIKTKFMRRPLYIWGFLTQSKQTNWIYIE